MSLHPFFRAGSVIPNARISNSRVLQILPCYSQAPDYGVVADAASRAQTLPFALAGQNGLASPINHRSGGHASRAMPLAILLDPDTM